jgi:uncharacterized repeat protein (TIGR01451 family)
MKQILKLALGVCFSPAFVLGQNISGIVFRDLNANGLRENATASNEVGIEGVRVKCTDAKNGTATTTTLADGSYTLSGCWGPTRVEFLWAKDEYSTPIGTGNNTNVQFINASRSDISLGIGGSEPENSPSSSLLASTAMEETRLELPPKNLPLEIGNRVWIDQNRNGIQDANEEGLNGVRVVLAIGSDMVAVTTKTVNGQKGVYLFKDGMDGLPTAWAGMIPRNADANIFVDQAITVLGTKYRVTSSNMGANEAIDSDGELRKTQASSQIRASLNTSISGHNNHNIDFGFAPLISELQLTKTANKSQVRAGDMLTYTLKIMNKGPDTAEDVKIRDVVPTSLRFFSASATQGAYDVSTGIWAVGDMNSGSSYQLTIVTIVN